MEEADAEPIKQHELITLKIQLEEEVETIKPKKRNGGRRTKSRVVKKEKQHNVETISNNPILTELPSIFKVHDPTSQAIKVAENSK